MKESQTAYMPRTEHTHTPQSDEVAIEGLKRRLQQKTPVEMERDPEEQRKAMDLAKQILHDSRP